jgi:hypothetical protein
MFATALMNLGSVLFPRILQDYERIHLPDEFGVFYEFRLDYLQLERRRGILWRLLLNDL